MEVRVKGPPGGRREPRTMKSLKNMLRRLGGSRTGKNALASYFAFGSGTLYGLLSIPLAVHFLSGPQLGLWNVISQMVGYLLWLDLGVSTAVGRVLAEPMAAGEGPELRRWWSSLIALMALQGLAIIALGIAGVGAFLGFFEIPQDLHAEAVFVFLGMVLIQGLILPSKAVPGVLLCQERFHWPMIVQGIVSWVNFGVFFGLLALGVGMRAYVYAQFAVGLIQCLWFWYLLRSGPVRMRFRWRDVDPGTMRSIVRFSVAVMAWALAPMVLASIPAVVLGKQLGLELVTIYIITARAPQMMTSLAGRTYHAFYPRLQGLHIRGEHAEFRSLFRRVSTLSVWITGFCAIGTFLFNRPFVSLLAKEEYFAGPWVALCLAVTILGAVMGELMGTLFYCAGRTARLSLVLVAEVAATFAAAWLLVPRLGLVGVALPVALLPFLFRIPFSLWFGPRALGHGRRELCGPLLMTAAWCLAGLAACAAWMSWWALPARGAPALHFSEVLAFLALGSPFAWMAWRHMRNFLRPVQPVSCP
jgi:O-antigen/teichoic acid export membrane protein